MANMDRCINYFAANFTSFIRKAKNVQGLQENTAAKRKKNLQLEMHHSDLTPLKLELMELVLGWNTFFIFTVKNNIVTKFRETKTYLQLCLTLSLAWRYFYRKYILKWKWR